LQSNEEAVRQDLALVAAARGWTLEQATAQRAAGDVVSVLVKRIHAQRPDVVVGSLLSREPGGAPSIFIKGFADEFVKDLVAKATRKVNLVDEQPYSFLELQQRAWDVHAAIEGQGFRYVVTAPDIASGGRIRAEVTYEAGLPGAPTEIVGRLPAGLRSGVDVIVHEAPVVKPEHAYGGMHMFGGGGGCTSGWSVISDAGVTGVATAGHCSVSSIVEPGVDTWPLTHQAQHIGTWGDVEWKTTSHIEPAQFFASPATVRDVVDVASLLDISINEPLCLYGRGSNQRNCSPEVVAIGVTCGGANSMVQTTPDAGSGGDSGGGWSFGGTAYGLHFGNCGAAGREGFSLAIALDAALGVRVRIS
jgi:hypothetical protein